MKRCRYGGEAPREQNYNCGTLFAGKLSELIRDGARPGQRAIVDSHGCTLTLAMNILMFISDTVILYHSPPGCMDDCSVVGFIINKLRAAESQNPFQWEIRNIHFCATNLQETDIIYGGEEKLARAIAEAKSRYKPRLIAVLVSCSSAIIGDDVESICKEYQEIYGEETYVIPFFSHGYQTHSWVNYADRIWPIFVDRVMKQPESIDSSLINFYRPSNTTGADLEEMERLVGELGLRANILPDLQSIDMIECAPEAGLNTGICLGYYLPLAESMAKKFGTPYTKTPYILGIDFTSQWLKEIGEIVGKEKDVKELIEKEKNRIFPELKELRAKLKGKKVHVSASHSKTLGLLQACHDLGMIPTCASSHFTDDSLIPGKKTIMEQVGDIEFLVGTPLYEESCKITQDQPDFIIGHGELTNIAVHLGFPTKSTYLYNSQSPHFGFQGVLEVGKYALQAITNPMRHHLAKHYRNSSGLNWNQTPFLNQDNPILYAQKRLTEE